MAKGDNYIYKYYQAIKFGEVLVGKWIILLYEIIINNIENKTYAFDVKKANHAIEWIETHCFHTEGPLAPGPLKLELWQKAIVSLIYGVINPKTGCRQFREVVLVMARKNGKSLFASAIIKYEWQYYGGFGAKIYCVAPKLDQADIIYSNVWLMTQLDPEWKALKLAIEGSKDEHNKKQADDSMLARHRMSDLFIPGTNSAVKKIAFSAKKSDGFNPSLCVCDEIASWQGEQGLRQYEVMKSGMGARPEGLMFSCSTSGYVNDSIYDEVIKRGTHFLLGDSKETRLLPIFYMIDDIEKWNDINELRKSNPNLGVSVSVDYMLEEIAIAEGSLSKKAEFLTKYCNVKQNSSLAWLNAQDVEKAMCEPLTLDMFRGCYCVAGIDLSQTTDLTSCCIVIEKNKQLYVISKFFLPSEKISEASARDEVPYSAFISRGLMKASGDNFIDYHDCFDWFASLIRDYKIYPLVVGYDRYSAQYLIKDLQSAGFKTDNVYQGTNLYPVLMEFEGLLKDGTVKIGNNDLLKIHLLNSAIKMDTEQNRGKLVKLNPNDHIDGTAALIDAMTVRQKWYSQYGGQLRNEGK